MPTVVHFIDNSLGSAYFRSVARWLDPARFSSLFVSMAPAGGLQQIAIESELRTASLEIGSRRELPLAVFRLRRMLYDLGDALVHAHTFDAGLVAALATSRRHPLVYTRHHYDTHQRLRRPLHGLVDQLTNRRSRLVVAPAKEVRRHLVEVEHVPSSKARVVYNGIEDHETERVPTPFTILSVGRLHEEKGFDLLLRALASVRTAHPQARLRIAGEGDERPRLERLVRELGLTDSVELLGHRRDVPDLLAQASVYCSPSRSEAFPIAVLEAMRAALPIVGTAVGGVPEQLGGGAGWLVEPTAEALAAALGEALGGPDEASRRGLTARARFVEQFTARTMVDAYAALYDEVLA